MPENKITKRLEEIFYDLCAKEGFSVEEIADYEYINDKVAIWYEMGLISKDDHDRIVSNWGNPEEVA